MSYDSGRMHLYTALERAWPGSGAERDVGPTVRDIVRVHNSRQIFRETLHPKTVQIDASQFCFEISARGDRQIHCRASYRCRVIVRIGERPDRARRHPPVLDRQLFDGMCLRATTLA